MIKNAILGYNSARLFNVNLRADCAPLGEDKFAAIKRDYAQAGGPRDNVAYGFVKV